MPRTAGSSSWFVQVRFDPAPLDAVEHAELGGHGLVGVLDQRFVVRANDTLDPDVVDVVDEAAAHEVVGRPLEDPVDRGAHVRHAARSA